MRSVAFGLAWPLAGILAGFLGVRWLLTNYKCAGYGRRRNSFRTRRGSGPIPVARGWWFASRTPPGQ